MKEKLFAHQTKDDYLVLNYDDVHTRSMYDGYEERGRDFKRLVKALQ